VSQTAFEVRAYRPDDEEAVLRLLRRALGNGRAFDRSPAFWQWKHFLNPFGTSLLMVATNGEILGLRAFMRWRFRHGSAVVRAVRAVDTATHPASRRAGIFSTLTARTLDWARADGVDLVFNTPNRYSLPGYLKLGWTHVGHPRLLVKIVRPGAIVRTVLHDRVRPRSRRDAPVPEGPAGTLFTGSEGLEGLIEADDRLLADGIRTDRSGAFFAWRYGRAHLLRYYVCAAGSGAGRVAAVFRPNRRRGLREIMVCELLLGRADADATPVVRGITEAIETDYLVAHAARGSAHERALRRAGFLPIPRVGPHLTVRPLRDEDRRSYDRLAVWRLSLGDLEVF
jgi:GNAT superfamily N-acetyltransferase